MLCDFQVVWQESSRGERRAYSLAIGVLLRKQAFFSDGIMAELHSQDSHEDEEEDEKEEKIIEILPDMEYTFDQTRWQENLKFAMDNIAEQKVRV